MKRNSFNKPIGVCLQFSAVLLLLTSADLLAQEENDFIVRFDISSIQAIFNDPAGVRDNADEFWKTDPAYRLADIWHRDTHVPKDPESWNRRLTDLAAIEKDERYSDPGYKLALAFFEKNELFQKTAVAHVKTFIPNLDRISIDTTIYVTAYTRSYAFMMDGNSVLESTSSHWKNDLNFTLNTQTHELFHVAYEHNIEFRKEVGLTNATKYGFLNVLQDEGIASYVGYTIRDVFPCENRDHVMMDDPAAVRGKIAIVNDIFRQADNLSTDEIEKLSWEDGVMGRAYYVTGGHMARTIDQALGRAALKETISNGPLDFVDVYNTLAPEPERVIRFPSP